ncbi:MAG TPA: hypothetical protein VMD06_04065 [Steroidobacteraceae bacterium]|nr:hypothetical protein [Steroidobacteraceae bacterium]
MTSPPQTQQRNAPGENSRGLACKDASALTEGATGGRPRGRLALPAIDPAQVFGCVDWFLYPEPELASAARGYRARG